MTREINPRPRGRRRFSDDQRAKLAAVLDRKVEVGEQDDCWPWMGSRLPKGYGSLKFNIGGQQYTTYAHRAAFERANGYLPKVVRHTCDNPACCNPNHLLGGDQKDNMRDMIERGRARHPHGSEHNRAKLTENDVVAIRSASGRHEDIALRYDINTSIVTRIKGGKAWKHVPGEIPPRNPDRNKGVFNGRAKLSDEQAKAIRFETGRQRDIAAKYGITQTTVSKIRSGRSWRRSQS